MRSHYHIERDFANIPMNFIWLEYHQVRFVSFGIWFLGLFLTDFTNLAANPNDGWPDVLNYLQVISIIHLIFLFTFEMYLVIRHFTDIESDAPTWKMIVQSAFDMSLHFDIAILLFTIFCLKTKLSIIIIEVFVVFDAIITFILTPYKKWRAAIDIFGILLTTILIHIKMYTKINYIVVFIPISVVLLCPLLFTICAISFSRTVSPAFSKIINFLDPSLLPNKIRIPANHTTLNQTLTSDHRNSNEHSEHPPSITERATTGTENDYYDFKSFPFFFAATFFIHYGCFFERTHSNVLIVMAHYFLTMGTFLINTRVVAFPSIIFTNVVDSSVQFNSVWPELSFV